MAVVIRDGEGQTLEAGEAIPTAEGSPWWTYTTQAQVTMSPSPPVEAWAQDLPGNTSALTVV